MRVRIFQVPCKMETEWLSHFWSGLSSLPERVTKKCRFIENAGRWGFHLLTFLHSRSSCVAGNASALVNWYWDLLRKQFVSGRRVVVYSLLSPWATCYCLHIHCTIKAQAIYILGNPCSRVFKALLTLQQQIWTTKSCWIFSTMWKSGICSY